MTQETGITRVDQVQSIITRVEDRISAALPDLIDKDRFMEIAIGLVRSNTDIQKCDAASIAQAIYGIARLGLIPDPSLGHIYIVPYGRRATVIPGYKGLIELARRSGAVSRVHTGIVHQNDEFDYWMGEDGPHMRHRPYHVANHPEPGKPTHAYCIASMKDGQQVEIMQWSEIQKIKNATQAKNVWNQHESEMARKTVVRRASKLWPLSPDLARAVQWDEEAERGVAQSISPQFDDEGHPPAVDAGEDATFVEATGGEPETEGPTSEELAEWAAQNEST